MKKICNVLLIGLMVFGLLSGCGEQSPAFGAPKTEITIAIQGEPTTMDSQYPDDGNMRTVTWSIYEPLFILDGVSLEPVPCLATSYKILDEFNWEFTMREGVKFHDGSAFSVDDAVYSVNRIIDPEYNSQFLSDMESIEKAEKTGDTTMVITTKYPDPILLKRLTKLDIVSKAFTEGKDMAQLTAVANGTGPYKLDHWTRGQEIVIVRFDDYWGEKPVLEKATYRFIEEVVTRAAALRTGEVDIAVNMYPEYVSELPKVFSGVGTETSWVRFNQRAGIMTDKRIRQAANYAIDLEGLAYALFGGYARPCQGQMGRDGYFGFVEGVDMYPYDVDKAKELLKEAGYNGEPIELVSERGRWLKDGELTEAVVAQLMEAGFNIQTKFLSWNEWLDTLFDPNKTPDMQFSCTSNEFFDMDRTYSALVHKDGSQSAVDNAEYNAMIEEARSEMDFTKRAAIYESLVHKLYDDPFAIYLLVLDDLHGGAANLNWTLRQDSRVYISEMSFD